MMQYFFSNMNPQLLVFTQIFCKYLTNVLLAPRKLNRVCYKQ